MQLLSGHFQCFELGKLVGSHGHLINPHGSGGFVGRLIGMLLFFAVDFKVKSKQLASEEVAEAKKTAVLERKFSLMVREVLWQLVLLALMLWVVVGNQDGNVYYQNRHLKNIFVNDMPTVFLFNLITNQLLSLQTYIAGHE